MVGSVKMPSMRSAMYMSASMKRTFSNWVNSSIRSLDIISLHLWRPGFIHDSDILSITLTVAPSFLNLSNFDLAMSEVARTTKGMEILVPVLGACNSWYARTRVPTKYSSSSSGTVLLSSFGFRASKVTYA